MNKPQLDLLLHAMVIMVGVFVYHLVRRRKELKHPVDFESHSTAQGRDVPISDLISKDP